LRGSSGIQRTLRFCQYLPQFGWRPVVLTVHKRAYESTGDDLNEEIPNDVAVERAFALDAARHLAVGGMYPRALANPDRWSSWFVPGVISGLRLVRRYRPRALFSTFPIATAHMIALAIHRMTGIPWVADFRDPMAQDDYPSDPVLRRRWHDLDYGVMHHAARAVFTSGNAIDDSRARYPDVEPRRWTLIENGFDEEAFAGLQPAIKTHQRLVMVHSGIVYSSERDPTHLFRALSSLKRNGTVDARHLEVRFRASANDGHLRALANELDIADLVTIEDAVPYRDALREMLDADALLLLQAANCNSQIPAKAYEYLRAGKPILALTDRAGDTASLLSRAGLSVQAPLDDERLIAEALPPFLGDVRSGRAARARPDYVRACSRLERTRALAEVLADVAH
jgi:hypothetical protein